MIANLYIKISQQQELMKANNPKKKKIVFPNPKQLSPLKDSAPSAGIIDHPRSFIPPLPHLGAKLSPNLVQQVMNSADCLKSIQLMKLIVQPEHEELKKHFYQNSDPLFEEAFQKTLKQYYQNLNEIRQQRIANLKEEQIIFVPPDQDKFEHRKGKVLNNLIKQYMEVHQNKKNFAKIVDQNSSIVQNTSQYINEKAVKIQRSELEQSLHQIMKETKEQNIKTIRDKYGELRSEMKEFLQMGKQMMKRKRISMSLNNHEAIKYNHCWDIKAEEIGQLPAILFSPQDYFL